MRDSASHSGHHSCHVCASVKPVLHFSQVALGILCEFESMMGTGQASFQISEQHIEPFERLIFASRFALRCQHNPVLISRSFQHFKSEQTIRYNTTSRCHCQLCPWRQGGKREPCDGIESDALRSTFTHFYCRDEGHFVLRSASRAAASTFATEIGIVNTHIAMQWAFGLAGGTGSH